MKTFVFVALLAACSTSDDDIVGPFTGPVHRYIVDGFVFPLNTMKVHDLGDDLDGDKTVDNQGGQVIATLATQNDVTTHAAEIIAGGVVASTFEIQADDLAADTSVGVSYFGSDDAPVVVAGGRFTDGALATNRIRSTSHPGQSRIVLPVFVDSDPLVVDLVAMQADLRPDGRGGYDVIVRGAIPDGVVMSAAAQMLAQMIAVRPRSHLAMFDALDRDKDGALTTFDFNDPKGLLRALVAPDLQLADGTMALSLGFGLHLAPCPEGRCTSPHEASCFDRIHNGTETDIDCGGSCGVCEGAERCLAPADCRTGACDAGRCRAPTCSDGVLDAVESDVDCGPGCAPCATDRRCRLDHHCASGDCDQLRSCGP